MLIAHAFRDHAGGNEQMVADCPSTLKVYGGDKERIGALTHYVKHDDTFKVCTDMHELNRSCC